MAACFMLCPERTSLGWKARADPTEFENRMDQHRHHDHHHDHGPGAAHSHTPVSFDTAFAVGVGLNIIIVLAELYWRRGRGTLVLWAAIGAFVAFVGGIIALSPDIARDRIWDYDNIAGRLVQYEQTSRLLQDRPWFGVGLDNFHQAALTSPWAFDRNGVAALDYSHSNIGSAFAETGLAGGSLYVMAHMALMLALLKRAKGNPVVRRYALYIFLAYWVTGLSLASGFYGDLNTWYLLSVAVVFCFAAVEPARATPQPVPARRR